ncbi:MAG: hypothetical protein JWM82_231, partial [Myxococcales bacterium]|nr:hypothetical protein [Myxococcales bacterium]
MIRPTSTLLLARAFGLVSLFAASLFVVGCGDNLPARVLGTAGTGGGGAHGMA